MCAHTDACHIRGIACEFPLPGSLLATDEVRSWPILRLRDRHRLVTAEPAPQRVRGVVSAVTRCEQASPASTRFLRPKADLEGRKTTQGSRTPAVFRRFSSPFTETWHVVRLLVRLSMAWRPLRGVTCYHGLSRPRVAVLAWSNMCAS
jgi:hypothetical protein